MLLFLYFNVYFNPIPYKGGGWILGALVNFRSPWKNMAAEIDFLNF